MMEDEDDNIMLCYDQVRKRFPAALTHRVAAEILHVWQHSDKPHRLSCVCACPDMFYICRP